MLHTRPLPTASPLLYSLHFFTLIYSSDSDTRKGYSCPDGKRARTRSPRDLSETARYLFRRNETPTLRLRGDTCVTSVFSGRLLKCVNYRKRNERVSLNAGSKFSLYIGKPSRLISICPSSITDYLNDTLQFHRIIAKYPACCGISLNYGKRARTRSPRDLSETARYLFRRNGTPILRLRGDTCVTSASLLWKTVEMRKLSQTWLTSIIDQY